MKKFFVIQEHNARQAGLHWDLRFEDEGALRSFAVPKHKLPEPGNRYLAIPTALHAWEYRNFEGTIENGYGAGTVKLIFSDYIEVVKFSESKIKFIYQNQTYVLVEIKGGKWLLIGKF